jgi:translation initiation factor IF-3
VRLVDKDGEQVGVVSRQDALQNALQADLDLVEVSPNATPPVCKIMDYGRYKFQASKKNSAAKKKQKQAQLKEIKFRPTTDDGDYNVKLRKIASFIENGDKVKVTIRYRGREMQHKELGMDLMQRLREALEETTVVAQEPKFEGRQMVMVVTPKKN